MSPPGLLLNFAYSGVKTLLPSEAYPLAIFQ